MNLTCPVCKATHLYRAVIEFPVQCLSCSKSFTPEGEVFDRAVESYQAWRESQPKHPRVDTRRRCPSGHLWYELSGTSACTLADCPAHNLPLPPAPPPLPKAFTETISRARKSQGPTEHSYVRTPRARTVRPVRPGDTRERIQYLALDKMEVDAIDRLSALVHQDRDYPDRNRDILLIGIAERLERIENIVAIMVPPDDDTEK